MNTYIGNNFNDVYPNLIKGIMKYGNTVPSRNGETKELHPAYLEIHQPRQRLVTAIGRPVNVAFALAEVVWILSGRQDVEMLKHYNRKISQWSDDGLHFNAAYGHRLRWAHEYDQIRDVIDLLREDPNSRQATLVTWSKDDRAYTTWETWDFDKCEPNQWREKNVTKDRACNVLSHLLIRNGALDWMQVVRSNDAMWGSPYNFMQFTHLQEWIARSVGVPVGKYIHVADSLHIYDWMYKEANLVEGFDLYKAAGDHEDMEVGDEVLQALIKNEKAIRTNTGYNEAFNYGDYWADVMKVFVAHNNYMLGNDVGALLWLQEVDVVYGAAQARFYWHHRWHRDSTMRKYIASALDWSPEVIDWITTRVTPASV